MEKITFVNNQAPVLNATNLNLLQTNVENAIKALYPVGCIYMTTVNTNPNTLFGFGTWESWGSGRVPVGVDTSQAEFNTVEETGGEKAHTLTVAEMPSHSHGQRALSSTSSQQNFAPIQGNGAWASIVETAYTANDGGGQSHNNLQPYITCYMWKRTA